MTNLRPLVCMVGIILTCCPAFPQVKQKAVEVDRREVAKLRKGYKTYHVGNSLMDTVVNLMEPVVRSAGYDHKLHRCTIPGAPTDFIWNAKKGFGEKDFPTTFREEASFDDIITQPFAGHRRSIENEAEYSGKFFELCRQYSPEVQLWLYQQWPSLKVKDAWSKGNIGGLARPPSPT